MATGMTEAIAGLDLGPVEEHRHKLILGVDYGTTYTGNLAITPTFMPLFWLQKLIV
jgi:hypothetical protein